MAPWTVGLVLDVALVDELLGVNHPMESQDTLLPVHPQLRTSAQLTARNPSVQLGKWMLPTAPNEGVPIIVLSLPSWEVPVLQLREWYNTMLPPGETAIKQDHLPQFEIFELGCMVVLVLPSLEVQLIRVLQEVVKANPKLFPRHTITFVDFGLPLRVVEARVVLEDVEEPEEGFPFLSVGVGVGVLSPNNGGAKRTV